VHADERFERLLDLADGNPFQLVEIARALWTGGAVRRRRDSAEWYVAADEVFRPGEPLEPQIAATALGALAPRQLELAALCAVIGDEIIATELDAIQRQPVARTGILDDDLDATAALEGLARRGILRTVAPGRFAFRHRTLREAALARIDPELARQHHLAVLQALLAANPRPWTRVARHAAACGATEEAHDAHMALAGVARRRDDDAAAAAHEEAARRARLQ
jgi:hypothetical protein